MKALFCCINFDYRNFVKKYFVFLSIFFLLSIYIKEKHTKLNGASKLLYLYLIIVTHFMNFMNFDFFFLQCKKIYTLKLIVTLNFLLSHNDICFRSFFFLPSLRQISIQQMGLAWVMQFAGKVFFQSPFEENKMVCLFNKFILFTNHKQLLKCVW